MLRNILTSILLAFDCNGTYAGRNFTMRVASFIRVRNQNDFDLKKITQSSNVETA